MTVSRRTELIGWRDVSCCRARSPPQNQRVPLGGLGGVQEVSRESEDVDLQDEHQRGKHTVRPEKRVVVSSPPYQGYRTFRGQRRLEPRNLQERVRQPLFGPKA